MKAAGYSITVALFLGASTQVHGGDGVGWPQLSGNPGHTAARHMPLNDNFTPRVVWRVPLGAQSIVDQSPVVSPTNGRIYIGTVGSNPGLVALNDNGTLAWKAGLSVNWYRGDVLRIRATPSILSNGSLIVPGYLDISSTDRVTGKSVWNSLSSFARVSPDGQAVTGYALAGKITSSPLRLSDNEIYAAWPEKDNADPKLYQINVDLSAKEVSGFHRNVTGGLPSCIWPICFDSSGVDVFNPNKPPFQPLLASPSLNSVFKQAVTTVNVGFAAPIAGSNTKSWQNGNLRSSITPVVVNGVIFTAEQGGTVRVSNGSGSSLWSYKIGSPVVGAAAASVQGSAMTFFVSSADGFLNAIKDGKLLWRKAVGQTCNSNDPQSPCIGSPVVLTGGIKHVVAVPSNNDAVYFYNEDGSFRLIAPLGAGEAPSRGTPAVADGRLYIATRSSVVALQIK